MHCSLTRPRKLRWRRPPGRWREVPPGEVGRPDVQHLALLYQRLHRLPDLVPRGCPRDVVHLVQVDASRSAAGAANPRTARMMCRADSPWSLGQSPISAVHLGGEDDLVAPAAALGDPPADDLLGDPFAGLPSVHVGRVEEVDAQVERPVHDGVAVVFRGLRAEVHRAEAQPADRQAGASEIRVLHAVHPSSVQAGRPAVRERSSVDDRGGGPAQVSTRSGSSADASSTATKRGQHDSRAAGAPPNSTSSQLGRRLRGFSPVPSDAAAPVAVRRGRSTASDGTSGTVLGASLSSSNAVPGEPSSAAAPPRTGLCSAAGALGAERVPGPSSGRSSVASSASRPERIGSGPRPRPGRDSRRAVVGGRPHRLVAAPHRIARAVLRLRRVLREDLRGPLGTQVLRHVVVRRDQLTGLVELPQRLRGRLAARPRGHDAPGAVLAPVRVPGDLLGVDAVLGQPGVDHLSQRGALVGRLQLRAAGVLGEHGPLLEHRTRVPQHPVDRHTGDPRDVVGALTGADAGLDVARGQ